MTIQIDEIDLKILNVLQGKGRTRRNELAEIVHLSIPSVSERLRKLEENGFIVEYVAKLNSIKLGFDITAFIFVTVDSSKHFQTFIDHANNLDEVQEIHAITGDGSHLLKVRTENTSTLEKLLSKIQAWSGIVHTKTHLVLSSPKETSKIKLYKK
ncbi:MAG: Lrp/AsnC family transcriptional regulator [Bacteroidetes bacterium]|nr:Lrp/AsnC family transcriptional regulator [Bacteroidota bacterium]